MAIFSTITGRLGSDAEVQYNNDGKPRLTFRMASDSGFGDKKKTDWVSVTLFGARGEKIAGYLTKGKEVVVSGNLASREFEGKNGKGFSLDVVANDIVFVGGKGGETTAAAAPIQGETTASTQYESSPF